MMAGNIHDELTIRDAVHRRGYFEKALQAMEREHRNRDDARGAGLEWILEVMGALWRRELAAEREAGLMVF